MDDPPTLFISAGDPSGDNAVSRVIAELKKTNPELAFFGIGGKRLAKAGQEQLANPDDLAVLGFWEVAQKYFYFRKLFNNCVEQIRERRPKLILLVDYPGFNLRLADNLKDTGIPIIYYISPQVWAWGKRRVKIIRQAISKMLVLLPFEEDFFREHGIDAEFVGHYLLEDIPEDMISSPTAENNTIGLLPGSRVQEVSRMLPVMIKAAEKLGSAHNCKFEIAGISGLVDYESYLMQNDMENITILYDDSRKVINDSKVVVTSSGTATLEAGIIGRPMVVIYKTGFLTYQIAKRLVKLNNIGLVNLVSGQTVVPELVQRQSEPARIVDEVKHFLEDPVYYANAKAKLDRIPKLLGRQLASNRVAEVVREYL